MKKLIVILIGFCFILFSCDSRYQVFIKNETDKKSTIKVAYYNMFNKEFDSIRFSSKYVDKIKPSTYFKLYEKKELDYKDSLNYKLTIDAGELVLLEPSVIGRPIRYVLIRTEDKTDTIFDPYDKVLCKSLKKGGLIERKGLSTIIIYLKREK